MRDKTNKKGKRSIFAQRQKWDRSAPLRGLYNFLLYYAIKLLTRVTIHNMARVPETGGVILIINHVHALDPVAVLPWFKRKLTPMAKVEAWERFADWIWVGPYGAIPVHRGEVDLQAIRGASEVLNSGGTILMSPEGTRSPTGALIQGQSGLAFLATRTGAAVVPVGIVGTAGIGGALKKRTRGKLDLYIGEPIYMKTEGKASREQLQAMTDDAMRALGRLLPENMRGVYG